MAWSPKIVNTKTRKFSINRVAALLIPAKFCELQVIFFAIPFLHSHTMDRFEVSSPKECPAADVKFKVYKTRWFILALYWFIVTACMMQFMMYGVIADVLVTFYNISYPEAGWSSMICLVTYLILVIPGSYILDIFGIKMCTIITMIGTCAGAWIKVGSVDPSRYWVLILGQGVAASIQSLGCALPLKIAAVWFSSNEVSTACAIGLIGIQVGVIVGMFVPPLVVQQGTIDEIQQGLYTLSFIVAGFSTLLLIFILFFFPNAPPTPPSYAEYNATNENRSATDFLKSLKSLLSNRSFIFLLLSSCLIFGVMYPMMINLNQLIINHYPDAAQDVGYILTVSSVCGLVGAFVVGFVLDKWHIFKIAYVGLCLSSSIALIIFMELIPISLEATYGAAIAMGVTATGLFTISIELGVELTYPEPQSISATLINAFCQISGLFFTYAHSSLITEVNEFWGNVMLYIFIVIGNLLLFGIRYDLKRKNIEKELKELKERTSAVI